MVVMVRIQDEHVSWWWCIERARFAFCGVVFDLDLLSSEQQVLRVNHICPLALWRAGKLLYFAGEDPKYSFEANFESRRAGSPRRKGESRWCGNHFAHGRYFKYMFVICLLYDCYMFVICVLYVCYMFVICLLYDCYVFVIWLFLSALVCMISILSEYTKLCWWTWTSMSLRNTVERDVFCSTIAPHSIYLHWLVTKTYTNNTECGIRLPQF